MNRLQHHLDELAGSAAFAMSLGAKELFHTNFLAFVLESENPRLQDARLRLGQVLTECSFEGRLRVWRENGNLDLVIAPEELLQGVLCPEGILSCEQRFVAVVEAKLKSVPSPQQLAKYDKRLTNGLRLDPRVIDGDDDEGQPTEDGTVHGRPEAKDHDCSEARGKNQYAVVLRRRGERWTLEGPSFSAFVRLSRVLLAPVKPAEAIGDWKHVRWIAIRNAFRRSRAESDTGYLSELLTDYTSTLTRH